MRADLHIHSYFSDGMLSPADIASVCVKNGVRIAALTDHDNMNGCSRFAEECAKRGVISVRGIEISAYTDVKVHILGYNLDDGCEKYKTFASFVYKGALDRTADILSKLKKKGINLTFDDVVRERRCIRSPIHTMYIARAAARKGYASSPGGFYIAYLAPGKPGYSAIGRPSPEYALEVIKDCGGISSLAHPGRITLPEDKKYRLIEHLCSCGLDAIEAVYSGHDDKETAYFKTIAEKKGLLVTGGSDMHYAEGNREAGVPELHPSCALLSALRIR